MIKWINIKGSWEHVSPPPPPTPPKGGAQNLFEKIIERSDSAVAY